MARMAERGERRQTERSREIDHRPKRFRRVPEAPAILRQHVARDGGTGGVETKTGGAEHAIATGFERAYGVLKRLGGSPLGRDGLLVAKLVVVGAIAVVQVVLLLVLAGAMGFRLGPGVSLVQLIVATAIGSATFSAIGLLLAGTLRPEATLVVANVLFLVALILGGVLVPLANLPDALQTLALLSPVGALAELFRCALGFGGSFVQNVAVVTIWGVGGAVLTGRYFRWD